MGKDFSPGDTTHTFSSAEEVKTARLGSWGQARAWQRSCVELVPSVEALAPRGLPASEDGLFWARTVTHLSYAEPPFLPPSGAAFLWISVTDFPQKCLSPSARLNCFPVP